MRVEGRRGNLCFVRIDRAVEAFRSHLERVAVVLAVPNEGELAFFPVDDDVELGVSRNVGNAEKGGSWVRSTQIVGQGLVNFSPSIRVSRLVLLQLELWVLRHL